MLQPRLHNKICSLPQHTEKQRELSLSSLQLKLVEQITARRGAQLLQVFMIMVWKYLTSWSNKSVIMACFFLALLKKKHGPVFIILSVFQCSFTDPVRLKSTFTETVCAYLSTWNTSARKLFLKPRLATLLLMQLDTFTEGTPWYNNLTARSISAAAATAAAVGRFAPGQLLRKMMVLVFLDQRFFPIGLKILNTDLC